MSEDKKIRIGENITIYRRGKRGTFIADFWHFGEHQRRSLKTSNLKVARERAIKLEVKLMDGDLPSKPVAVAIALAVDDFITYKETENRRPKTVKKYKGLLKAFREFVANRDIRGLNQITPSVIDQFRAHRKLTHAAKSMHNEGVMLKGFLRWCVGRQFLTASPMQAMIFERPLTLPRGGPSLEQVDQILARVQGQRLIMLAVLAFTGMRSGELQHLQFADVDLEDNWIHIVSREGAETKTGHSRKVPIHPRLRSLLETIRKTKRRWFFTAAPSKKFPAGDHWISTKHLNEDFLKLLKGLEIPAGRDGGFTLHGLRHFFKTFGINAGVPKVVVDIWQGHSVMHSAADHYYKLTDEASQRFMRLVPFDTNVALPTAGNGT